MGIGDRGFCDLKANCDCGVLFFFVALRKLMRRKDGGTARAVWKNVLSLVNHTLVPERFCDPPDCFHKVGVHGFVVVVKIDPAPHAGNRLSPFARVL